MKNFFVILILLILTQEAFTDEALVVRDFKISSAVGNLTDSKAVAFQLGLDRALEEIMRRLQSDDKKTRQDLIRCLNKIEKKEDLVEKIVIKSERMTSKSYSAFLDITFKKDVTSFMNKCGISYGSFVTSQSLLIPILMNDKNDLTLLDSNNHSLLYDAFSSLGGNFGSFGSIKILNKNTIENYGVELEDLVLGNYNNTRELQNQLKGEVLLIIVFSNITSNKPQISVKISTKDKFYNNVLEGVSISKQEDYAILVQKILQESDLLLKRGLNTNNEAIFNSLVLFELAQPNDWQKLRLVLNKIPEIKEYRFKTIGNDKIELELRYSMNPSDLSHYLLKEDISLFKRNNQTIMKLK